MVFSEATVNLLISELYALRGVLRQIAVRVSAVERIFQSGRLGINALHQQTLEESEKVPSSLFPLEDLEELRKALLQNQV